MNLIVPIRFQVVAFYSLFRKAPFVCDVHIKKKMINHYWMDYKMTLAVMHVYQYLFPLWLRICMCVYECVCASVCMYKNVFRRSCKLHSALFLCSPCWASWASCVCFGTRSWPVCRSGWYSGWSPGGAPETDTCWTRTPSPAPASGALCRDIAFSSHFWLLTSFPLSFPRINHLPEQEKYNSEQLSLNPGSSITHRSNAAL